MTGREGLIDTAIKTADTGYISRKLMKGLEDLMVKYDGTVRSGNNSMIQYLYGDSNFDQTKQKSQKLTCVFMGNKEFNNKFVLNEKEITNLSKKTKINVKILKSQNKQFSNNLKN